MHQPVQDDQGRETKPRERRGCLLQVLAAALLMMLVGVVALSAWTMRQVILTPYKNRVYPNVHVLDENLGGMTREEAAGRVEVVFADSSEGDLILTDGHQTWRVPWSEAGMRLDADATADQAFAAGRGQGWPALLSMWLGERRDISLVFTIDGQATRRALTQLAPRMHEPPTDATLQLEGDHIVTTPSQPGRELDIEATLEKIVNTVTHLGPDYPFSPTFRAIPPRITDVSAAKAEAEDMLSREIRVLAQGEFEGEPFAWNWALGRDTIFSWLRVEEAEENPGFVVRIDEEAVRATVEHLAAEPQADDWGFPTEETIEQVLGALEAGGGEVGVELTPPPRIYVVQSGDHLTVIAAKFGMPPGLIAEVNRGVDLDHLQIGQELVIPPQEALWPHDPVPGKRIVISIAEQRLRVYQDGQLLYDWPSSTGMRGSPTYTGEFQILSKEEMAYASQWNLQMPHFLSVYRAGGDTYNGIHGLPFNASGQRLWWRLGSPGSYGCIVLGIEEAETLFNWAELGVPVTIQ